MTQTFRKSLRNAVRGVQQLYREESNFRIQVVVAALTVAVSSVVHLSAVEYTIVILVISFVLALELTNAALERCLDGIEPRVSGYAKAAKDMMAGAVLIMSCCAVTVAVLILLPACWLWLTPLLSRYY